ncbi:MAG TPA: hypothetical protein VE992_01385, partial [Solirubrobacteraceae bacterium]|nr:hypothetical protein [Solirubrobacteraceae bacterium]
LSCGVAAVLVYTWVTAEQDPHDSQQWFGIHPPRAGPAPDAAAFAAGLKAARGAGASTPCITR